MANYTAIYLITQFFLLLVASKIVGVFYEKRRTSFKAMLLLLLSIYFVLCSLHLLNMIYLLPDWLSISIRDDILFFVGCAVITLNYESTIARRLAAAFSTIMIILFSSLPIIIIVQFLLPSLKAGGAEWIAVVNIALVPIVYIMAAVISFFKKLMKLAISPRIALIAPLFSVFIVIIFLGAGVASAYGIDISEEVVSIVVLIILAWLIFSNFFLFNILSAKYEEKLNSQLQAQEKEYYFAQCQLMQESAEQVKAVRHDIKIHLAALKGFTLNGSMEDIHSYLGSIVDDIEKSEIYSNTGNIAFDSIINYKLRNAKNDNIKLDLNIAVPPEINIDVIDIVTVLGNLLDNALEAVAKAKEKTIKIDIKFSKGGLFVKVENSFNGEVKYDVDKAKNPIISSKSGNEHGYGLRNINQSVEKYNGHIKISHTESTFSTGVFLYVSDR